MGGQTTTDKSIDNVTMCKVQAKMQFVESAVEAMPQVILQSAFIIRSNNDSDLRDDNSLLLFFSLIASVISVANKYRWFDDGFFDNGMQALKTEYIGFQFELKFPGCINWWYLVAAIWRYSHIITRFTVFSLIWGVCGGWWMAIYTIFSLLVSFFGNQKFLDIGDDSKEIPVRLFFGLVFLPGIYISPDAKGIIYCYMTRWLENLIGYALVAIFASVKFSCLICADEDLRQFGENDTIDRLFIIGCSTWTLDVALLLMLKVNKILDQD